jgi:hypothetical protein
MQGKVSGKLTVTFKYIEPKSLKKLVTKEKEQFEENAAKELAEKQEAESKRLQLEEKKKEHEKEEEMANKRKELALKNTKRNEELINVTSIYIFFHMMLFFMILKY